MFDSNVLHIAEFMTVAKSLPHLLQKVRKLLIPKLFLSYSCILLKKALNGCDGIFHLAAFKDVILAKEHPLKAVQTNILGTLNLLKITVEEQNIKFILATSTDKAVQVSGTYGATKLLMENLFGDFEQINGSNCAYRIVRYGNVLHSTGSVLVKWKYALENRKDLSI